MKKPHLAGALFLGLVVIGCTSILGDFEVSPGATSSSSSSGSSGNPEGGPCTTGNCDICQAGQTKCGDTCVDTQTSAANCGACNRACPSGLSCTGGNCVCPDQGAFCNGQCFPRTDRQHCGVTCIACTGTQVCDGKCVDPPPPEFDKLPLSAAGWTDVDGKPATLSVKSTNQPGTKYECRSGLLANFTPTVPAWGPCDGATGDGTTHTIVKDGATPDGTYQTEYRYKLNDYTSPVIHAHYYMHSSLDGVATCPRKNIALDGPHFTDQQYFDIAKTFATANAAAFPTTSTFPAGGELRADPIYLGNPWIKIPFANITHSNAMGSSQGFDDDPWPAAGASYVFNERSLRHRWVINADRTMILVARQYVHPGASPNCKELFHVGNPMETAFGPPGRGKQTLECEAYILNTKGNALCLMPNPNKPEPQLVPFDQRLAGNAGANLGTGRVQTYANDPTLYSPTSSFTAGNGVVAGAFIQIPDQIYSRWYKIASVNGVNQLTLSESYAGGALTNQTARVAPATAVANIFVIPTGFAKLQQDAHSWGTGKKRIPAITGAPIGAPRPSVRTKCETPGCNTGKPWLTYLPP